MIKEYIGTGKTVELATQDAKLNLNAPAMADVKIEIIEMPKKKILGLFGGSDAKVKASYDDGKKEPKKQAAKKPAKKQAQQNKPVKKSAPKAEQKPAKVAPKAEPVKKDEPKKEKDYPESVDLEYAKQYLAQIVKGLDIDDAKIDASYDKGLITMNLECENFGIIIGRRGETLDSIQYLLSLAMKKSSNGYVRVTINIGNYREKRTETLKHLAHKNAAYVLKTGRRYTFEPMNPYERRVIHTTVQEIEGVESRSIGSNQDRRVVLEPTGGVKPRTNARSSKPATASAPARAPKADRADAPKFGKITVPNKD